MDSIDKKILDLLQENGRITVKEITQTISLTAPAVSERIKRMEKEGKFEFRSQLLLQIAIDYMVENNFNETT